MQTNTVFNVFVLSESSKLTENILKVVGKLNDYRIYFLPCDLNIFDALKFEPDVLILDDDAKSIVNCYQWKK